MSSISRKNDLLDQCLTIKYKAKTGSKLKEPPFHQIRSKTTCETPSPYRARARPRTPAAPARPIVTPPVGAAPPSAVEDSGAPDSEAEAEEEAASEPVGAAEEDDPVIVELDSSTEVDSLLDEAPELEALVEVASAVLGLVLLALLLVISAATDDANDG